MEIEASLTQIEAELRQGHGEQPEMMLKELMRRMRKETLTEWRPTLEPVIERFQRRRRRRLLEFLDARIRGRATEVRESSLASAHPMHPVVEQRDAEAEFRDELRELSEKHIFQWATSYRDCLFHHFDLRLSQIEAGADATTPLAVRRCLSEHSHEIFTKGYGHERDARDASHLGAVQKSVGGLARFLDLPLDYYSVRASTAYQQPPVLALRALFCAAFTGILEGYAAVSFGDERGDSLLPRFSQRWGHNLAFLTRAAAMEVVKLVEPGPLTEGIERSVVPLLESIDRLIKKQREDYFPLPLSSRFSWKDRFLEVGVRAPRSASSRSVIEARVYLDAEHAFSNALTEARARNLALVVAPLKPDVREFVRERQTLADMVVEADGSNPRAVADRAEQVWSRMIYSLRTRRTGEAISHNIAREFPLNTPNPMPFYRVQRTSVRDLLRAFDRTNGVRLWCSVRRSGKTTACFGLDYTAADSVIVSQTCGTGPTDNARTFFEKVCEAAASGSHLSADFVEASVAECAPVADDGRRKVLIIDEYETLFGFLQAGAEQNSYVRYTVVQPLLNQFVEFARDNLLVLLGQQPDAHFILMDQNQLAPYVRQDEFPLFEHVADTRAGELGQLVGKVLTERIGYDPGFLGELHRETAGHPFLTVNVLCALVDWLIAQKRPHRGLKLRHADFAEFREAKLNPSQMAMSRDYDFFRETIKQAMGTRGYKDNRWLFTVYWVLREISRSNPEDLSISRSELNPSLGGDSGPGAVAGCARDPAHRVADQFPALRQPTGEREDPDAGPAGCGGSAGVELTSAQAASRSRACQAEAYSCRRSNQVLLGRRNRRGWRGRQRRIRAVAARRGVRSPIAPRGSAGGRLHGLQLGHE